MKTLGVKFSAGLAVVAVFGAWLIFANLGHVLTYFNISANRESLGQWGDAFGGLSALFGSLGFLGLMYTLFLQRRQIQEQQIEIEEGRRDQYRQRFESSFFQLLSLMRELRDNITMNEDIVGFQAIETIVKQSGNAIFHRSGIGADTKAQAETVVKYYEEEILRHYQNTIGPYCRIIYNMLDRLRRDGTLSSSEKADYARLLRGQLTDDEISLIGLNGMSSISKDFKKLLADFRILKYAENPSFLHIFKATYPRETFESRRA